jgi:hypothetical protein
MAFSPFQIDNELAKSERRTSFVALRLGPIALNAAAFSLQTSSLRASLFFALTYSCAK